MKYLKTFGFLAQLGAAFVALLFVLRTVSGLIALAIPFEDAVINWLYENAIVFGLTIGIGFLLWWFADACDAQDENDISRYVMKVQPVEGEGNEDMEEFVPVDEDLMDQLVEVAEATYDVDDEDEE